MGKLDIVEDNSQLIFHTIENHDFTFIVSIGPVSVLQFISKIENTKYLFISDDTSIVSRFGDIPYQTSVYDQRFSVAGSSWLTYDLALYLISEDHKFFELFDFIVLDGIGERQLHSEFLLSMILNLQMKGKLIIPIDSSYKIDIFTHYIQSFGYSTNVLKLFEEPSRSIYHLPTEPHNINKELIKTIDEILKIDETPNQYDILVIVSSYNEVQSFKTQLLDVDINHDFSILTDTSSYKLIGAHRRIIITEDPQIFLDIDHKIRYIVDSGIVRTLKLDENALEFYENRLLNKTTYNNRLSILQNENSSYFGIFAEESVVDYEFGLDGSFVICLMYLLKNELKINEFRFLKAPGEESIRIAINLGIYLGLFIIENEDIRLTDLGSIVSRFQVELNISSLSLFTALSSSNRFNCTKELLKISTVILSVNVNSLSKSLDSNMKNGVQKINVPNSDFLTLLNIFNMIIENEQHVKNHNNQLGDFIREINKESQRQILHCYKQLRNRLSYSINPLNANEDDVHKCLFFGYQLHCGVIIVNQENVSNIKASSQLTVKPIKKLLNQDQLDNILIVKSHDLKYELNDIIIFHNCEYLTKFNCLE